MFRENDWRPALDLNNADTEKDVCPQVSQSLSNTDIGRASGKQYATNLELFCLLKFALVAMSLSISISIVTYECGRVRVDSSSRLAIILRIWVTGMSCYAPSSEIF